MFGTLHGRPRAIVRPWWSSQTRSCTVGNTMIVAGVVLAIVLLLRAPAAADAPGVAARWRHLGLDRRRAQPDHPVRTTGGPARRAARPAAPAPPPPDAGDRGLGDDAHRHQHGAHLDVAQRGDEPGDYRPPALIPGRTPARRLRLVLRLTRRRRERRGAAAAAIDARAARRLLRCRCT